MDHARALLNELMGVARDLPAERKDSILDFTGEDVCKCYLAGLCPHELFVNTKSDIGPCEKRLHEEFLKKQYEEHGEKYREEYELYLLNVLERMLLDLEKKRRKGKERLEIAPKEELLQILNPNREDQEEKVVLLEMQLAEVMRRMEQAGEEGRVQEAEDMTLQVEKLKMDLEKAREEANPYLAQEKNMQICEVCGAFLVMNDTQRRLEAHFEGRQHLGYMKVREKCAELKVRYKDHPSQFRRMERMEGSEARRRRSRSPAGGDRYVPPPRPNESDGRRGREENGHENRRDEGDERRRSEGSYGRKERGGENPREGKEREREYRDSRDSYDNRRGSRDDRRRESYERDRRDRGRY